MSGSQTDGFEFEGERLYFVSVGRYVQFDGYGEVPAPILDYIRLNKGEWPPYFPLPDSPVLFVIGRAQRIPWPGRGQLPRAVVTYVTENGILPRYSTAADAEMREADVGEGVLSFSCDVDDWDLRSW